MIPTSNSGNGISTTSKLFQKAIQKLFNTKFYNYDKTISSFGLLRQEKATLTLKKFQKINSQTFKCFQILSQSDFFTFE